MTHPDPFRTPDQPRVFPFDEEARQALFEHSRLMREQRAWAAANRERIDAEWDALEAPPLTIAQHLARKDKEPQG